MGAASMGTASMSSADGAASGCDIVAIASQGGRREANGTAEALRVRGGWITQTL